MNIIVDKDETKRETKKKSECPTRIEHVAFKIPVGCSNI